ncbi:hypothetical protein [Flavobacterium sp. JAS]|nr:hypothetical protein [Flavobacterium sp. JAS]MCD0470861.1 hypothetical protein [Flavobacterium sp. JAS]
MKNAFYKMSLLITLFSLNAFCQTKESEGNVSVSIAKMVPLKEKVLTAE